MTKVNPNFDKSKRDCMIWADNRDEIFFEQLTNDINKLYNAGLTLDEIKTVLGCKNYVKFWAAWPSFAYPADKLPKGYKWSDGIKYKFDYGRKQRGQSTTYTFLDAGDDLYIRYGNGKPLMPGLSIYDNTSVKIIGFRKLTAVEVYTGLRRYPYPSPLYDCVLRFWHDNGLRLGFVLPVLRPMCGGANGKD